MSLIVMGFHVGDYFNQSLVDSVFKYLRSSNQISLTEIISVRSGTVFTQIEIDDSA
jgi:hypothetical protein